MISNTNINIDNVDTVDKLLNNYDARPLSWDDVQTKPAEVKKGLIYLFQTSDIRSVTQSSNTNEQIPEIVDRILNDKEEFEKIRQHVVCIDGTYVKHDMTPSMLGKKFQVICASDDTYKSKVFAKNRSGALKEKLENLVKDNSCFFSVSIKIDGNDKTTFNPVVICKGDNYKIALKDPSPSAPLSAQANIVSKLYKPTSYNKQKENDQIEQANPLHTLFKIPVIEVQNGDKIDWTMEVTHNQGMDIPTLFSLPIGAENFKTIKLQTTKKMARINPETPVSITIGEDYPPNTIVCPLVRVSTVDFEFPICFAEKQSK